MFTRAYPTQTSNSDVSVFNGGFRLSGDFINRENLKNFESVWLFVDKKNARLGIVFHPYSAPQSISLTPSSKNTQGKTVWCAYLKENSFIKRVMEDPEIKNRRFPIRKTRELSDEAEIVQYQIDLSKYADITF